MSLTESEKRQLRGRAHRLKPCVLVGMAGVTAAVRSEIARCLNDHELIKIRVRAEDRAKRNELLTELVVASGAELVSRIGNVAVLYRRDSGSVPGVPLARGDSGCA